MTFQNSRYQIALTIVSIVGFSLTPSLSLCFSCYVTKNLVQTITEFENMLGGRRGKVLVCKAPLLRTGQVRITVFVVKYEACPV